MAVMFEEPDIVLFLFGKCTLAVGGGWVSRLILSRDKSGDDHIRIPVGTRLQSQWSDNRGRTIQDSSRLQKKSLLYC